MKKPIVFAAVIVAVIVVSWILALLTILVMQWAAIWPAARSAIANESVPIAAAILALFVAESLLLLAALVFALTKFPEAIGAAVDVFQAARGQRPTRRSGRSSR